MGTKQKKGSITDLDRISELPKDLKEKALVRLPIKEAVKTSCLSSKWMYACTSIPNLVFNEATVNRSGDIAARTSKLAKFIDIVLLLHQGPIRKFTLNYYHPHLDDVVRRWMVILSRNGIKELVIGLDRASRWNMPSSVFYASSLTDVHFENCVLKLPRSFNGLEVLKSLLLVCCPIGDKDLENLISSSPHLENLELRHIEGVFVRISAPNLKHIYIAMAGLKYIQLITPVLQDAILHIYFGIERNRHENLLKDAFGSLCNIETLDIGSDFMEVLANLSNMELPVKFPCLKKLFFVD